MVSLALVSLPRLASADNDKTLAINVGFSLGVGQDIHGPSRASQTVDGISIGYSVTDHVGVNLAGAWAQSDSNVKGPVLLTSQGFVGAGLRLTTWNAHHSFDYELRPEAAALAILAGVNSLTIDRLDSGAVSEATRWEPAISLSVSWLPLVGPSSAFGLQAQTSLGVSSDLSGHAMTSVGVVMEIH